ncbi:O-linked N-acetylglucosamine transferase, SPINDLY family protein [Chamaesiphon sp. VAR_48_metabat_403]|uniref:O-linked N-acetylglucosamine transferase, SPINDLY family protein n=1 Tax=Chamaesiphon sp. VAR_48_metabat_403 TaxID=2964700 RepID=UPI00286EAEFE|nr:O-linked N-acetylglucosamine transferase, SPINDLY family protein [Chamaesiphon sp. VAR_48_metabat_403]
MQVSISNPTIESLARPSQAIDFYEAAIATDETIASNYWHLGIAYLLSDREDDAQAVWFIPLSTAAESEIDNLTEDLLAVLARAANDYTEIPELETAWLLCQQIWALAPDRVENSLHSLCLASQMGILTSELLVESQLQDLLSACEIGSINDDLLESAIGTLVTIQTDLSLELIEYCLQLTGSGRESIIIRLIAILQQLFDLQDRNLYLVKLVEVCDRVKPDFLNTLQGLSYVYSGVGRYSEAITAAEKYYQLAPGIIERLFGSHQLQRVHFTAGNWQGEAARIDLHRQLLKEMIEISPQDLDRGRCKVLLISSFFLPYTEDNPLVNKSLQNQIAALYQQNIHSTCLNAKFDSSIIEKPVGCLRIGYIGSTLKKHSVGWLSRWLLHHHDRQSFQVFLYCINLNSADEFNHQWFRDKVDITSYFGASSSEVVAQIRADEIDILIDLDSLTLDVTCLVMAEKPAPVQVSWLGWDSTGIPAIDYFVADPYVLPDDAQDYYQEKIWRLPRTYLAVDGFEIGTPTLRRADLNIPADAVIYLSGQSGYKRHPDCIRNQMQIIKSVPNSYFLIKGDSDAATIQDFFGKLATEVGLDADRLRFLGRDRDEYTHRANLAIADIVLDTFPYNGATTTLETLWMGIPMVTQVGQQFAARNSYTFMLNAGITEGIAWSPQEYIDWGIKLGLDRDLRDKIHGKLKSGRATAPVWNAKQFTRDMEQAYRDMWAKYQQEQHDLN